MARLIIFTISAVFVLAGCTSMKPLVNNPPAPVANSPRSKKVQFLNYISTNPESAGTSVKRSVVKDESMQTNRMPLIFANGTPGIENAGALQFKYSILLNTDVEQVQNLKMYNYIDQWYGTPYCMGGTTKSCIDCSAFVQIFFTSLYGVMLPRTAREQHKKSKKISRTEMQEGDLLFFNTTGGVSHVGIYLQNNKFVHASSGGVTISDVFDPYWVRRFIDVGRVEKGLGIRD